MDTPAQTETEEEFRRLAQVAQGCSETRLDASTRTVKPLGGSSTQVRILPPPPDHYEDVRSRRTLVHCDGLAEIRDRAVVRCRAARERADRCGPDDARLADLAAGRWDLG